MNKQQIKLTEEQIKEINIFKNDRQRSALELQRSLAVLLINKHNSCELIKELTNHKKNYASALRKKYIEKGLDALKDRARSQKNLLTKNELIEIVEIIKTKTPKDFGQDFPYWTVPILAEIIKKIYKVQFKSKSSLYLIFQEAKFSYHKPDKQYKKHDQAVIDAWKKEKQPVIEAFFEEENTVVLTEDEMILTTRTTTQKIWLPKNEFPKIDESCTRALRCLYGFLNIKTGQEHVVKAMKCNSEETIKSLDEIGQIYKGYKIVIIWDNAGWHKSQAIKDYLKTTIYNFYLINFPPYSPELNPQEHVWKAGRSQVTHNNFIANINIATDQFIEYLNTTKFEYKFLGLV